jgi:hypothetical protein
MTDWADQVDREGDRYRSELASYRGLIHSDRNLKALYDAVVSSAAERSLNAGYSGAWNDGGASQSVHEFKNFLDGVQYANGGKAGKYQELLDNLRRAEDPEYKKYLALKEKFGDDKK